MNKARWAVVAVALAGAGVWLTGQGSAPPTWPQGSGLALAPNRPTVVLFALPGASTSDDLLHLRRFVHAQDESSLVYVLFARDADAPEGSEVTDAWHEAAAMRAVVLPDPAAAEARRFGVSQPGQIVVYQSDGALSYAGSVAAADLGSRGAEPNVALR